MEPMAPMVMKDSVDPAPHAWDSIMVDGNRRMFQAFYPPANADPTGLVIFLHFLGGRASQWCSSLHVEELTLSLGFVAICPQAEERSMRGRLHKQLGNGTKSYWRAFSGRGYGGQQSNDGTADLDFLDALVNWASERSFLPANRVFLFGCSNGGSMAYRVACQRPEKFNGIGVIAQEFTEAGFEMSSHNKLVSQSANDWSASADRCAPTKPLSLWSAVGTADPYYGTTASASWKRFSHGVLGCTGAVTSTREDYDLRVMGVNHSVDCLAHSACTKHRVETRSRFCSGGWGHRCHGGNMHRAVQAAWEFWVEAPRSAGMERRSPKGHNSTSAGMVWTKTSHCGRRRCRAKSQACEASSTCSATYACAVDCGMPGTRKFARCFEEKCTCKKLSPGSCTDAIGAPAANRTGKNPSNMVPGQTDATALAYFSCLQKNCEGIGRTNGGDVGARHEPRAAKTTRHGE